jgi:hypothetical protein
MIRPPGVPPVPACVTLRLPKISGMASRPGVPEPTILPIIGHHAAILDTIAAALAAARALIPRPDLFPADLDIVACEDVETMALGAGVREIAEALMTELVGGVPDFSRNPASMAALGKLREILASMDVRMNRKRRDEALGDAAALIREIGLERYDFDCHLATAHGADDVLASAPVPRATAHAWLLGRLLQRTEMFVIEGDEFLVMERRASAWYFDTWSAGGRRRDGTEFTRTVREQEWSLVSRDSLALEEPVMMSLIGDERFAAIPPRQQRLANALQQSIIDVFEATALGGRILAARSIRDGITYHVHEHNDEVLRLQNVLMLGRLIPFEDGLWLRSPGAVAFSHPSKEQASLLAEGVARMGDTLPAPIIIEAMISTVAFGEPVPRAIKPSGSARDARALLDKLYPALDDLGLREDLPLDQIPSELVAQAAGRELQMAGFALDQAMGEWMEALSAQARAGTPRESVTSKPTNTKAARKGRGRKRKRRS